MMMRHRFGLALLAACALPLLMTDDAQATGYGSAPEPAPEGLLADNALDAASTGDDFGDAKENVQATDTDQGDAEADDGSDDGDDDDASGETHDPED